MTSTAQTGLGVPTLEWVMSIHVAIAAGDGLGTCTDGQRSNFRILGGHFEGLDVRGEVLAGGADFYLQRSDGVGELDARYSLLSDRGELINIHNIGVIVLSDKARELDAQGIWPVAEHEYQCTCSPRFQVASGRLDWLTRSALIGKVVYPAADQVAIHCYRIT
nr:DUF3237 domain-containing protein [uncultured Pseudomonas sp.]